MNTHQKGPVPSVRRYLAFEVGGRIYAIQTERVQEVKPNSPITPVPNVPDFLLGVVGLRREIIPVVDLARLLEDGDTADIGERACHVIALIADQGRSGIPVGFLAERVLGTYRLDADQIDPSPNIGGRILASHISGIARIHEGIALLLDIEQLFASHHEDIQGARVPAGDEGNQSGFAAKPVDPTDDSESQGGPAIDSREARLKILSVCIGQSEYAFPLREISRVILAEEIQEDHLAPDIVCGVMTHSNQRMGIVDLHRCLDISPADAAVNCRSVVVAEHGGMPVGYLVDGIGALYDMDTTSIRKSTSFDEIVPSREYGIGFVELDDQTLEVLSFERLVGRTKLEAIRRWKGTLDRVNAIDLHHQNLGTETPEKEMGEIGHLSGRYLLVAVGSHLMGLAAADVSEVLPNVSLFPIPRTDKDFAGALLLRDRTYPVMNIREHFDLPFAEDTDCRAAIVLVREGENLVGLQVQQVLGLTSIAPEQLKEKDAASLDIHERLVLAVAEHEKGCVYLLNVKTLLADHEQSLLGRLDDFQKAVAEPQPAI